MKFLQTSEAEISSVTIVVALALALGLGLGLGLPSNNASPDPIIVRNKGPNVLLVMTDDQGMSRM